MNEAGRKSAIFLPSLADALFVSLLFYLAFIGGKDLLGDGDTGYHVRVGEFILKTRSIPHQDMFSFITPPIPWTAHEWLSEVIMALIHKGAGLTGVVLFFSFLIALSYYLFFKIIRQYGDNIYLAIILILLVIASSKIHFLARPHIFSLLLMVVWYFILDVYQSRNRSYLYLLPPLMLLWVNLHGGYVVGLFLTGVYFLGNLLSSWTGAAEERRMAQNRAKKLAAVTAVCLIAALINPIGYHILLFPLTLVSNGYLMDHVTEFVSPNFHQSLTFKYVLLAMIALFAVSREKLTFIEVVLIVFFVNMSLYSVRYIPLFTIIAAPVIFRRTDSLINDSDSRPIQFLKRRAERIAALDASATGLLWPVVAVVIVIVLAAEGKITFAFSEKAKPVAAVEFMKRERIPGNMFNNDEFGDYVIYSAHQQYRVFIDGRLDMYGAARLREYYKVTNFEHDWRDVISKYRIGWIFFDADSPLSRYLLAQSDWRLIYADKVANIFVRNIPEYRDLIARHPNVVPVKPEEKPDAES